VRVRIGTAGWAIGRAGGSAFPAEGSGLERYARVLPVAEINSSFHRPHRPATWERWRDSVPDDFRFSVKISKVISHERKLADCEELIGPFLDQVHLLGDRLAVLLLQLPPKLGFDAEVAGKFLTALTRATDARIVVEPRHASWFAAEPEEMLIQQRIARVAADPAITASAAVPGGWRGFEYWRLHGSPQKYRSSYADRMEELCVALTRKGEANERWCIFDNTASSAAIGDALDLHQRTAGHEMR